jgi:hypothetical protein
MLAAFAVVDDHDAADLLPVAVAVRMGMGEGGAACSGEQQGGGGKAEPGVEDHRVILPFRASGC